MRTGLDASCIARFLVVLGLAACGSPKPSTPAVKETKVPPPVEQPSSIVVVREQPAPDPYQASSEKGVDAPVPYVRDERSSRLELPAPKTRGKEAWRAPLALGDAPPIHASFVLAAGNRAVVVGTESWVLFDTKGVRIAGHEKEALAIRVDRASGAVVPDETRSADLPPDSKVAAHDGLVVMVKNGGVYVGERAIEGTFEAFDLAIDEKGIANVIVKQKADLSLWTVPIAGNTAIGRHKIGANRRSIGPPVLGTKTRVVVLDTGVAAFGLDGKKLWEQKGVPTGGVSITSDDRVLIADGNRVVAVDAKGKKTEIWSAPDLTLVTPPILNASGLLLVASGSFLHGVAF